MGPKAAYTRVVVILGWVAAIEAPVGVHVASAAFLISGGSGGGDGDGDGDGSGDGSRGGKCDGCINRSF